MASVANQPSFWLDVKKEYVIDNFESLLVYLRDYTYIDEEEKPDGDFNRTFKCLKAVVEDYIKEAEEDCFFDHASMRWGEKTPFVIRVIGAYLLTSKVKKNTDDLPVLAKLADMLLLMGEASTQEMVTDIKELICNCMKGKCIESLGYSWGAVMDAENFSMNTFCYKVSKTVFFDTEESTPMHYEGKGLLMVQDNAISLVPMNHDTYLKRQKSLYTIFDGVPGIGIKALEKIKQNTFAQLKEDCWGVIREMHGISPSPKQQLKAYENGDELVVKITSIGYYIGVETVDPAYHSMKGNLYLKNNYKGATQSMFMTHLQIGDYLKVTRQNHSAFPFTLDATFDHFYVDFAEGAVDGIYHAIHVEKYIAGHRWLTEEGLQVNVMGVTPEAEDAIDNGSVIKVKVLGARKDKYNNLVLNGEYVDDDYIDEDYIVPDFKERAQKTLIEAFVDDSKPAFAYSSKLECKELDKAYVSQLAHAIYFLAEDVTDTMERFKMLFVAQMLARMVSAEKDMAYIKHEMDYLSCLVRFAQGEGEALVLKHDSCLNEVPEVLEKEQMIAELCLYDNRRTDKVVLKRSDKESISENIKGLVDASNILNGKINPSEINRIKKTITGYLGVADMYQNICSELTYYGEESDTLEFKSSIVYPPNAGMQPDSAKQKWPILKTICGFLNTITGGELLLGVNDNGNSCGLKQDIDYLYSAGLIPDCSIDKLRNYVKNIVDWAFVDDLGMASHTEITSTRIKYIIEQSNEGDSIIRIQVSPYEYGIVSFSNREELPEGMVSSYYRTSGATLPMTSELKRQARDKKLTASLDQEARKLLDLQKSIKEKKVAILKSYSSQSGIKDRKVEVFQLLPERNAIIGYDLDRKQIREFKVTRFNSAEISAEKWKHENKHKKLSVDVFDMLENPNQQPMKVVLKLKRLAYNLLLEEYGSSEKYIRKNTGADAFEYPYILDTYVNKMEGVGRFYIGLAREIQIVEGNELRTYACEYVKSVFRMYDMNGTS